MKHIFIKAAVFSIFLVGVFACKEDVLFDERQADGIPPEEVTVKEILPKVGKLIVKWDLPADEDFQYVKVSYLKGEKSRILTYSKFNTDSIIIGNLNDEEYEITFKTVDESGTISEGFSRKATPLTPAYKIAAASVDASSTVGAIIFNWENPSGDTLLATILVEKNGIDSIVDIKYTGQKSTVRILAPYDTLTYKIEFKDPEQNSAVSEKIILAAKPEIMFDRTRFASDFKGYSPFTRVFDGQYNVHFAMGGPLPKTIPFNYNQPIYLSRLFLYVSRLENKVNTTHFPKEIELWTSMSGLDDDFVKQGDSYQLKEVEADYSDWYEPREIVLDNVPQCKYIKLVVNSTYSNGNACVIGEIELFGAESE